MIVNEAFSDNEIKASYTTKTINIEQHHENKTTKQNNNRKSILKSKSTLTLKSHLRSKTVKNSKPLIVFDTPPVVPPISVSDSDYEEDTPGWNHSSKKNKEFSKKRYSNLYLTPNEEDDNLPLEIVKNKRLSKIFGVNI